MQSDISTYPNLAAASVAALDLIEAAAIAAIADKGFFTLVLAGGGTPRLLYQYMAAPPCLDRNISWPEVHFFWGDERCVDPAHPESSYALARKLLLDKINPPPWHVHRILADIAPPGMVARAYEEDLRAFFAQHPGLVSEGFPCFDLVLLGMGTDGHTASLFPGSPVLEEKKLWVAAVTEPTGEPALPRVTLTLPVLNQAHSVVFLTAGPRKKALLEEIVADPDGAARRYPAARVHPARLNWLHAEEKQ
jgi:6-phosphogluconolactonase